MRGKLAKAIRKATRFHPAHSRVYETVNHTEHLTPTGRIAADGKPEYKRFEVCSFISSERRADYQELKQRVLARKRGGHAHA